MPGVSIRTWLAHAASRAALSLLAATVAVPAAWAMPSFVNPAPVHRGSVASQTPSIAVDITSPDGIDALSVRLFVNGIDVTTDATLAPLADGYQVQYLPLAPLPWGGQVAVDIEAMDLLGNPATSTWTFFVHEQFPTGTIVLVADHTMATAQRVYDAYGMAIRLAGQGYEVHWVIAEGKAYGGIDMTATVDLTPNGMTPGSDGTVASRSYRGAPFLVPDPDPDTPYNEAWDGIASLISRYGYAPILHEIRNPALVSRRAVVFLRSRPSIATADGLSETELDLAQVPYTPVEAPGEIDEPDTVAGGALFEPTVDPLCGRLRRYDITIQGHYNWEGPDAEELRAIAEYDEFLAKAGMSIFECLSASIEDTAHWITRPPEAIVEGASVSANYTPDPGRLSHPFLQTMDPIPIQGGGFSIWDVDQNEFRPNLQNILFDPGNNDIGYVFGSVGSGKAYFMGGHQRGDLSDRRLLLNAVLYNAAYPKFSRGFAPAVVVAGVDNTVTVQIVARGGSDALGTVTVDSFDPFSDLIPGTVELYVPGSSYTYDGVGKAISFDLGDLNPRDYPDGVLGSYQVNVHPMAVGFVKILDHTTTYSDKWGASYRYDSDGCSAVRAGPHLEMEKLSSVANVVVGTPTRARLTLVLRNNHARNPLHDVIATDQLPAGVTFVPGSIVASKGVADWGVTTPNTLTWVLGIMVPQEEVTVSFDVTFTPSVTGSRVLNDGASASALDKDGMPMSTTSNGVTVAVHPAGTPVLDFSLTPAAASPGLPTTFTFCATNVGAQKKIKRDDDSLVLEIPASFGTPTNLVAPAGWVVVWDNSARTLTYTHPGGDIDMPNGTSFCFQFDLIPPDWPALYDFPASGSIDGGIGYAETLPVQVLRAPQMSAFGDESSVVQACDTASYLHTVHNEGTATDVYQIRAVSSLGYDVRIYEDTDSSGGYSPADRLLADNDGDGFGDTSGVLAGESLDFIVFVTTENTEVDVTDITTVTVRSDDSPSLEVVLSDVTDVRGHQVTIVASATETCQGVAVTLDAGAGHSGYLWSTSETTRQITVSPAVTTDYDVDAQNLYGCVDSDSIQVVVHEPVPADAGSGGSICTGQSVRIGTAGLAGYTYAWTPVAGLDDPAAAEPLASPSATTLYTVTATETVSGCGTQDSATVTLLVPSVAADAGPNTGVCAGSAVAIGTPAVAGYTYLWSPATGLDDPTAAQPMASVTVATVYTVTATETGSGCGTQDSVTVSPQSPSELADAGPDALVCEGQEVRIGTPGVAGYTYSWTPPTGLDDPTLAQPLASPTVPTIYRVTATETVSGCSSFSDMQVSPVGNSPMALGNVLKAAKTNAAQDIRWRWTDPLGVTELVLESGQQRDQSDLTEVATVPGGPEEHIESGGVIAPSRLQFYQILGRACGP